MKKLADYTDNIQKCSKCGLCQAECPIYKITGNDCTVSRGHFNMLKGVLDGDLCFSRTISKYLDLCLSCNSCQKFCPSGIEISNIIATAKSEYLKKNVMKKVYVRSKNFVLFNLIPNIVNIFKKNNKSKTYEKKVLYFGGCASKIKSDKALIKLFNKQNIQLINPSFNCCGVTSFIDGDFNVFEKCIDDFVKKIVKYDIDEIIVSCASCEKTLKSYYSLTSSQENKNILSGLRIRNIYEYLRTEKMNLTLSKPLKITYHKPCNIENFEDIEWILNNTKNLDYVEMENFDKCCGLNGITNLEQRSLISKICESKYDSIMKTKSKIVATSCFGCETALKIYSKNKYKVYDLIELLSNCL